MPGAIHVATVASDCERGLRCDMSHGENLEPFQPKPYPSLIHLVHKNKKFTVRVQRTQEVVMSQFSRNLLLAVALGVALSAHAQTTSAPTVGREPTLYLVPYAHLDTQWRWEFPQTISEYLLKTMRVNFSYLNRYPHYVFNWTGSNRYRLMKEYFPADYERIKRYVAQGRWFPAGSSVEEGDVNLPSAESIFRQILYGNTYFRKEFGKASNEYMLPDSFGFPASLPTILAHAGIKGFSTQKLASLWAAAPLAGGRQRNTRPSRGVRPAIAPASRGTGNPGRGAYRGIAGQERRTRPGQG